MEYVTVEFYFDDTKRNEEIIGQSLTDFSDNSSEIH